jgi:hypothetical protein
MQDRDWIRVIFTHPWLIPGVVYQAGQAVLTHTRRFDDRIAPAPGEDPELYLYERRGGWLVPEVLRCGLEGVQRRFSELSNSALPVDPYSCSQRLGHLAYLRRLLKSEGGELSGNLVTLAHRDAARLIRNPEFRRSTTWFNNHLLNNWRAAVLYRSEFYDGGGVEVDPFIMTVEKILVRHWGDLFIVEDDPVSLNEGSVSYEIATLIRLSDVSLCAYRTPLADRIRTDMIAHVQQTISKYRKGNVWLIPEVGDITPDWRRETLVDFLDAVHLRHRTVFFWVWESELNALGFFGG